MPPRADRSDPFRGLADPTRREILTLLTEGPLPVRMIAARFPGISRPAVSKHLRVLRECGLLAETQKGRERYYELQPPALENPLRLLEALGAPKARRRARAAAQRRSPVESPSSGKNARPAKRTRPPKSEKPSKPDSEPPAVAPAEEGLAGDDWRSW